MQSHEFLRKTACVGNYYKPSSVSLSAASELTLFETSIINLRNAVTCML